MSTVEKKISSSSVKTQQMGSALAKQILKNPSQKQATIIALKGDLGSGKTTFIQGLARGLGIKEKITSPTFVIMRSYPLPANKQQAIISYTRFYHLDCYRLENEKDLIELDFRKVIHNPSNIIAIEWPKRIKKILPKDTIWLNFKFKDKNSRFIYFTP
jgi:tRNA threonylcarbamoyladenosine biosynthesis protein TsaE